MIRESIQKNRSYRKFFQEHTVTREVLAGLVDLARLSPSAANVQPLKFALSHDEQRNAIVFPHLSWAGYLNDWPGPAAGERPSAYIIILDDTAVSKTVWCDHGIAAQSILLGAVEAGLGGCIIGSIDREGLRESLSIPAQYDILLVIALGKPKEEVIIETIDTEGDIKYWRDEKGVHHVPKRKLEDIIVELQ
jgi:nitroreductase